jgi:DNA-binding response OmpR family regulator
MSARLLVVDDDPRHHELMSSYLKQHGYEVARALDGPAALARLELERFDAVLLDVMMPGLDGLEVCRRIRKKWESLPVIMLTARGDETDRIVGLEIGADDYLPKPFNPRELLARLRAVLRRSGGEARSTELRVGRLRIDPAARTAWVDDVEIELTGLELDILAALAKQAGEVIARERLLGAAGRSDVVVSERAIDVHISHLRQKLGEGVRIKTVRGVGYVLSREAPRDAASRGG